MLRKKKEMERKGKIEGKKRFASLFI